MKGGSFFLSKDLVEITFEISLIKHLNSWFPLPTLHLVFFCQRHKKILINSIIGNDPRHRSQRLAIIKWKMRWRWLMRMLMASWPEPGFCWCQIFCWLNSCPFNLQPFVSPPSQIGACSHITSAGRGEEGLGGQHTLLTLLSIRFSTSMIKQGYLGYDNCDYLLDNLALQTIWHRSVKWTIWNRSVKWTIWHRGQFGTTDSLAP